MPLSIKYNRLFRLNFYHHYFLNRGGEQWDQLPTKGQEKQLLKFNILPILDFIPDQASQEALKGHRLLFRTSTHGFLISASPDPADANKPFIPIGTDLTFRIGITLKDPLFFNYTKLDDQSPFADTKRFIHYFNNDKIGFPGFSHKAAAFVAGADYLENDIVLFKDKKYVAGAAIPASPPPDTGGTDWAEINTDGFDRLRLRNSLFLYTAKDGTLENPIVNLVRPDGGSKVLDIDVPKASDAQTDLQINLKGYPAGRYELQVTSGSTAYTDTEPFYLAPDLYKKPLFGIIEIKAISTETGYSLMDGAGNLLAPDFEIRLLNRLTTWKYIDSQSQEAISDGALSIEGGMTQPLPLTHSGFISIKLAVDMPALPNADNRLIKKDGANHISEIYINKSEYAN